MSLKCFTTAGKCVAANAALVVTEKLQGKRLLAVSAKATKAKTTIPPRDHRQRPRHAEGTRST